jgi:hypothetical protein
MLAAMKYLLSSRMLLLTYHVSIVVTEQAVVNDVTRVCRVAYNNGKCGA